MKAALVSIIAALALVAAIPTSKILAGTNSLNLVDIEFNNVVGSSQSYQANFGEKFDVAPNFGLACTGIDNPATTTKISFGWQFEIGIVDRSSVTITITTVLNSFNSIKAKYIATQGDKLQVFYREIVTSSCHSASISFNYNELVTFDPANLPAQVFIGTFLASFQSTSDNGSHIVSVTPAYMDSPDHWGNLTTALNRQDVYGANKTFNDTGDLMLFVCTQALAAIQFTLFLHRVSLENPPTNGYYRPSGYLVAGGGINVNTSVSLTNPLHVGQKIMGIVAFAGFAIWRTASGASNSKTSINFTDIEHVPVASQGYDSNSPYFNGLFYLYTCDANCATCSGPFADQCLTCNDGSTPVAGSCSSAPIVCPNGCKTCSSSTVCITCDLRSFRIAAPDTSHRCPCLPRFYENSSGKCVQCPATCATCELSGGSVACLSCQCAQHRELNSGTGACDCKSGFVPDTTTPGPYCLKTLVG